MNVIGENGGGFSTPGEGELLPPVPTVTVPVMPYMPGPAAPSIRQTLERNVIYGIYDKALDFNNDGLLDIRDIVAYERMYSGITPTVTISPSPAPIFTPPTPAPLTPGSDSGSGAGILIALVAAGLALGGMKRL